MTKCYRPRQIDLRPHYEGEPEEGIVWYLTVAEVDGDPEVLRVSKLIFQNGTVTDNEDGSVTIAGGSGGPHSAHFSLPLPVTTMPYGVKNKTKAAETIFSINIIANGECAGSVVVDDGGTLTTIKSFSFAAGGGEIDDDNLDVNWPADARITVDPDTFTQGEDGSQFAVSLGVQN